MNVIDIDNVNDFVVVITTFTNVFFIWYAFYIENSGLDQYIIMMAGTASFLHHITTTSHDLKGIFTQFSTPLLWFDRAVAVIAIVRAIQMFFEKKLWYSAYIMANTFFAITFLVASDVYYEHCPTTTDKYMYGILHSFWHIYAANLYYNVVIHSYF